MKVDKLIKMLGEIREKDGNAEIYFTSKYPHGDECVEEASYCKVQQFPKLEGYRLMLDMDYCCVEDYLDEDELES